MSTVSRSQSEFISQLEAAEILGCTGRTVRNLIASGQLPAARIGKSQMIRIKRSDVYAVLKPIPTTSDIA
jgi:excisionase family DNA binding protein